MRATPSPSRNSAVTSIWPVKPSGGMTETPEISVAGTRHSGPTRLPDVSRAPAVSPLMDTNALGRWSADVNSERHRIVGEAAAVLHGQGRRTLLWRWRLRRRGHRRLLPTARRPKATRLSWPAGRCEDGMAMTRSVAMLAAIATAIEKRMTQAEAARADPTGRGARTALRPAPCPSPPAWPARRPW